MKEQGKLFNWLFRLNYYSTSELRSLIKNAEKKASNFFLNQDDCLDADFFRVSYFLQTQTGLTIVQCGQFL